MTDAPKKTWVIASDIGSRDGIGVELLLDDQIVLEIFRDDTKKSREVSFFRKEVPLDLLEEAIAKFKKEIPWEFLD